MWRPGSGVILDCIDLLTHFKRKKDVKYIFNPSPVTKKCIWKCRLLESSAACKCLHVHQGLISAYGQTVWTQIIQTAPKVLSNDNLCKQFGQTLGPEKTQARSWSKLSCWHDQMSLWRCARLHTLRVRNRTNASEVMYKVVWNSPVMLLTVCCSDSDLY